MLTVLAGARGIGPGCAAKVVVLGGACDGDEYSNEKGSLDKWWHDCT